MGIQENMANTIRMIMEARHKSLAEFSEELEISRSTLQDYLKAKGNPSIVMIEHLAKRLQVDPAVLLTGLLGLDQREILLPLLNTVQEVADLPESKQLRFAEIFLEMVQLWNGEQ